MKEYGDRNRRVMFKGEQQKKWVNVFAVLTDWQCFSADKSNSLLKLLWLLLRGYTQAYRIDRKSVRRAELEHLPEQTHCAVFLLDHSKSKFLSDSFHVFQSCAPPLQQQQCLSEWLQQPLSAWVSPPLTFPVRTFGLACHRDCRWVATPPTRLLCEDAKRTTRSVVQLDRRHQVGGIKRRSRLSHMQMIL